MGKSTKKTSKKKKDSKDLIGESGFPLQKEIEKLFLENKSIFYPHQTEIPLNVPPEYSSSKFVPPSLDFLLVQTSPSGAPKWSLNFLTECKKAYQKDWYLFTKLSGSYYKSDRVPISAVVEKTIGNRTKFVVSSRYLETASIDVIRKPIVCDNIVEFQWKNNKLVGSDRSVAYEACGTLSLALFHHLKVGCEVGDQLRINHMNPDQVRLFIPMIVTTAKLYQIDSNELDVNLDTGKLKRNSIKMNKVDYAFFEYPILPSLRENVLRESQVYDFGKDMITKMGCIIVSADKLLDCLDLFQPLTIFSIVKSFTDTSNVELF